MEEIKRKRGRPKKVLNPESDNSEPQESNESITP